MGLCVTKMEVICSRLDKGLATLRDRVAERAVAEILLDRKMADLAKSQEQLADSHAHTDQRLTAFIDVVRAQRQGKGSV